VSKENGDVPLITKQMRFEFLLGQVLGELLSVSKWHGIVYSPLVK
jgi:hypothetical protein